MSQQQFCKNCGAQLKPGDQFCEKCGQPVEALPAVTTRPTPPNASVVAQPAAALQVFPGPDPLLTWDVDYPESLSRWKIFFKWLLAIPHYLILWLLGIAASVVVVIAWFAILITAKYPRGLFDFMLLYLRWTGNVQAYILLQRDEYPPFGDEPYPARLDLAYPDRLSRWKIFLKWLLIIPSAFVWSILYFVMLLVVILAWFAILVTGNMPRGLFDFITGVNRWGYRINAYSYLMTDKYPPFSLD